MDTAGIEYFLEKIHITLGHVLVALETITEKTPIEEKTKFRTVMKLDLKALCWVDIEFEDIKRGDRIRLFESDGTLHSESTSKTSATPFDGIAPGNWAFEAKDVVIVNSNQLKG